MTRVVAVQLAVTAVMLAALLATGCPVTFAAILAGMLLTEVAAQVAILR